MARFNTYSQIISNQNSKTNDEEDDENLDLEDVVLDEMENQFAHLEPTKEEDTPVKAIFKEIRIEIGDEIKVSEL